MSDSSASNRRQDTQGCTDKRAAAMAAANLAALMCVQTQT